MWISTRIRAYCQPGLAVGLLLIVVCAAVSRSQEQGARQSSQTARNVGGSQSQVPQYTASGELKLPEDFESWVFVGANLGLEYRDGDVPDNDSDQKPDGHLEKANFHNVYINPEAFEHFTRTGKFPEQTILVLDVYQAEAGEPRKIVSRGLFPGKRKEVAVAVKNSARPDGSKTDWAYYDFPPGQKTARAFPDKACYDCHLQHADRDNVWTQFYPTLRDKRPAGDKSPSK